jgi:hypothetical protein
VDVGAVLLTEPVVNGERLNLVSISLTPWLNSDPTDTTPPSPLPHSYVLRLKFVPHLVTPATVADAARRQQLLCPPGGAACTADAGVLLTFEFYELFSNVHQQAVSCASSNYNLFDEQVLTTVYQKMGEQAPLLLPVGQLTGMVSGIAQTPVNMTGVTLGTDGDLKVGFLLDAGAQFAFDPFVTLSHFANADWGVFIDPSFITTAVQRQAVQLATADPRVKNPRVDVAYTQGSIDVNVSGFVDLPVCGFNFTASVPLIPRVCKNAAGVSVLQMCSGQPVSQTTAGVCSAIVLSFTGGAATAVVGSGGSNTCTTLGEIQFGADTNDVFYATDIDTDGVFYIGGRSTFMDGIAGIGANRQPMPPPCP